ncbi:MAG: hypothetical protein RLZZ299_1176 [Pseudomonadota bacterium]
MAPTLPPGCDPSLGRGVPPPATPPGGDGDRAVPSTLGGPGWQPRVTTLAEERGWTWAEVGVASEVAPLRAVALAVPGPEFDALDDPAAWLMDARPDPARLRAEHEALAAAYTREGITVHRVRPAPPPPPNFLFQRDPWWMTPEGAVVGRMAARQRAGEEAHAARFLADAGVPILLTIRGGGTFEGADALWLDERTVLLGVGRRTNAEGAAQLTALLATMGVTVRPVPLAACVQHLLGAVNLLDADLAAVRTDALTPELRAALGGRTLLELAPDAEVKDRRAMNFVTLRSRRVLMPTGCPATRARLEAHGVACVEAEVGAYVDAAGGMGCATGILRRG